ncbi:hydroxymethylbilane synthase [Marinoscillum furvescens]|uniref:Hydroxymethylbilane synthase n=1 Tax=Marinoscillum furvescens DSM 4134 TaxID=1122208 RepID=A0A3D9L4J1_MARFU|nr:hydroxymethylbilane synthase [Marinoscillum furvescens]RED98926.1 hydroxymethylbilane synthase [Marinoscillum furvescens DSM 4134]
MEAIKIGTRKSKLALWQAEHVATQLNNAGLNTELVLQETKGDKVLDVSIAKIGSKGVFTEELEEQLATGVVDIAVHSAKDMQSRLPEGFEIIAFSEREKINDVIVGDQEIDLQNPNLVLGTSSTRRVALFRHFYPHIKTVDVRGNLQTRIQKMRDGLCDGLVLAYAGVHRMGYDDMIGHTLSDEEFIPAVGQGSVAIEAHSNLDAEKRAAIRQALNDPNTEKRLLAERAYLAKLEGGCSIPVFALAQLQGNDIRLQGGIVSLDGGQRLVKTITTPNPAAAGEQLADEILAAGGDKILAEIRKQL